MRRRKKFWAKREPKTSPEARRLKSLASELRRVRDAIRLYPKWRKTFYQRRAEYVEAHRRFNNAIGAEAATATRPSLPYPGALGNINWGIVIDPKIDYCDNDIDEKLDSILPFLKRLEIRRAAALEKEKVETYGKDNEQDQRDRRLWGGDDKTLAAAAAYAGKSRTQADAIKPRLREQLSISKECPYCTDKIGDPPHADHIFPVVMGGLSTIENMVYVCEKCNLSKGEKTLSEFIEAVGIDRNAVESRLKALGKRF